MQDLTFQLERLVGGMYVYCRQSYKLLKPACVFPIEVQLQLGPPGEEEFIASSVFDEERERERSKSKSDEVSGGGSLPIEGKQQDGAGQETVQQSPPSSQSGTVVEDLISID